MNDRPSLHPGAGERLRNGPRARASARGRRVWLTTIHAIGLPEQGRVLDFGAGTGALMAVLKRAGLSVIGLEPSEHMVAEGLRLHPGLSPDDFVSGANSDVLSADSFDLIVSRQVLCHLTNPDQAFARLDRWLRPGGWVLLVDGFWTSFSPEQQRVFPLAVVRDPVMVAGALAAAGFDVERAEAFDELNCARAAAYPDTASRYVIAGRKSTQTQPHR